MSKELDVVIKNLPSIIKEIEEKERKSNIKFAIVCNVVAGANLACGNVVGWAICSLIGAAPYLKSRFWK